MTVHTRFIEWAHYEAPTVDPTQPEEGDERRWMPWLPIRHAAGSTIGEDDTGVEHGVVKVIVDSQSAPLLVGTEVDYVDSMQRSGFVMKNPHVKTTCGCGSSFSV